jgi:hypothetical protein
MAVTVSSGAHAQNSWEMLDNSRPIRLLPWAVVCKTIRLAETVDDTPGAKGCMSPKEKQVLHVRWLGSAPEPNERYQHVVVEMGRASFEGWTLGIDLMNDD